MKVLIINPLNLYDEKEELYHDGLIYIGGNRATVYIANDSNAYHVDKHCKVLYGNGTVYKVFLNDTRVENQTICTYSIKSM